MEPLHPGADGEFQPGWRKLRVRYGATCVLCGTGLPAGAEALYHRSTKTFRCLRCPTGLTTTFDAQVDAGTAGASAQREYERRTAKRETAIRERWGDGLLSKVARVLTDEPQSTRAWAEGAGGERALAEVLAALPDVRVLHDRRVPGTQGNIDHLVVAPAGIFVVDAKRLGGRIEVRDVGPLFQRDLRLFVGRRDRSRLADGLTWQVQAVAAALGALGFPDLPPITPVLCFVEGDWPVLWPPSSFRGVRLEGTRSIQKLVTREQVLDDATIDRLTGILARAFPPK